MKSLLYWRKSMINGAKTVPAIVAMDSAGDFVVTWSGGGPAFDPANNPSDVFARRFKLVEVLGSTQLQAVPAGDQFQVSQYLPSIQNASRVAMCRAYGAEVVLTDDVYAAFEEVERIQQDEGRTFIHPFEGERTVLGTATVGYELCNQIENLDAVIVPVGGGGLIAGIACAVKQMQPHCKVYGVEPEGADSMSRSFKAGSPQKLERVNTIADSLAAPYALPYSFGVARKFVDEIVLVSDEQMQRAMGLLFADVKLAVEPAGAAATAALCGPLREHLDGKRIAAIVCGTNIDLATFTRQAVPYSP